MERIVIIGGGGAGAALAHDLVMRGFSVTLIEKGNLFSGTTGRHHGLLHSGARYAVNDPSAARECIEENRILRKIVPGALEQNGGLFVAVDDKDMAYAPLFAEGCAACGIPIRKISPGDALSCEVNLVKSLRFAYIVPDAVMDAWRLPLHFAATARLNGAVISEFTETVGIDVHAGSVNGVRLFDRFRHKEYVLPGDIVVNAAGAWAGRVASLAGLVVPLRPAPGVMVSINARLTNMVINRLHGASEGDIVVPQRRLSILGTTLRLADDPDDTEVRAEDVKKIVEQCAEMIPAIKTQSVHAAWSAARPLIDDPKASNAQAISRTFDCFDHEGDGVNGLITLIGGKATTLRAMAEKTADLICRKTGRDVHCTTREIVLSDYRNTFRREAP
ncbi:MAG: FAD-dependent oxidoreductase [Deltaproteobacteria bacterium]|nr:FAD-dependent oxidoreductase [Deltaproteobacteria bacterium]